MAKSRRKSQSRPTASPSQVQAVAIPYAVEDGEIQIGLVTAHRSRNWLLPKASVGKNQTATDIAAGEALRQGGYVGLAKEEPLLILQSGKGLGMEFFSLEVDALLESWEADRHQSRRLVPLSRIEKYADRITLKAVHALVEEQLGLELAATT